MHPSLIFRRMAGALPLLLLLVLGYAFTSYEPRSAVNVRQPRSTPEQQPLGFPASGDVEYEYEDNTATSADAAASIDSSAPSAESDSSDASVEPNSNHASVEPNSNDASVEPDSNDASVEPDSSDASVEPDLIVSRNQYREHLSVAVVLPFIKSQIPRIRSTLSLWTSQVPGGHDACTLGPDGKPPNNLPIFTLVFYYDKDMGTEGPDIEAQVASLYTDLGRVANCFVGGVQVVSAKLSGDINKHPCGPCAQFFSLFDLLKENYSYFLLVEPDVIPVRSNWLTAVANELPTTDDPDDEFWMKGSISMCNTAYGDIGKRMDLHINGNAMFKLGSPAFEEYIERVKAFYPGGVNGCQAGCSTGREYENGHDHTLFQYRMQPQNFDYVRGILNKFQISNTILNLCEDAYQLDAVLKKYPKTFFVHSKGPYLDTATTAVHRAFKEVYKIHTDYSRQNDLIVSLRSGALTETKLYVKLCSEKSYLAIHANHPSPRCLELCNTPYLLPSKIKSVLCRKHYEREEWLRKFPGKKYIWTSDFHGAPIACNTEIYNLAGAEVHAEIDFGNCIYSKTCKERLKVLANDNWRGFGLDPCPNKMRRDFFEAYRSDPEFERVDAFICSHPVANCELYMPFNRSVIVYATTRMEFGRYDDNIAWRQKDLSPRSKYRWEEWVDSLKRIGSVPGNVIAANNLYDAKYIEYFTGVPTMHIPSWCGLPPRREVLYNSTRREILLGPYRDNLGRPYRTEAEAWNHPLLSDLRYKVIKSRTNLVFKRMAEMYKEYTFADLASHRAIVIMPYQVSMMSLFEYYRLSIPLFAPSKELLLSWHQKHDIVWERIYGHPHCVGACPNHIPYPNSNSTESFGYWMSFMDIYTFPHVVHFNSWDDLIVKLETTDFNAVSRKMAEHNREEKRSLVFTWKKIFSNLGKNRNMPDDMDVALKEIYGQFPIGPDPAIEGRTCPI